MKFVLLRMRGDVQLGIAIRACHQVPRAGETVPTSCYTSYFTCWMMLNDVDTLSNCQFWIRLMILHHFGHLWAKFQLISVVQASQWQRALTLFSAWHLVLASLIFFWTSLEPRHHVEERCAKGVPGPYFGHLWTIPSMANVAVLMVMGALTGRQWNFGMPQWLVRRPSLAVC